MYCITDEQVDYILNDIRRNGVDMEDLQLNLLDHICCIIEQSLEPDGNFEAFYQQTVKQFYKHNLREIEEETIQLLTFKNYYAMKKSMIVSGVAAVTGFVIGSIFKVMHWPGAGILLLLGISVFSFVFLPLMLVLKIKESSNLQDKLVMSSGTLTGLLFCMACLFTVQHWPGATALWFTTVGFSFFIFIPLYFFNGIRNAEKKVNTIVTSTMLIGATACLFLMVNIRPSYKLGEVKMYSWIQSEQLLQQMQQGNRTNNDALVADINNTCDQIKSLVLENAIGEPQLPADFAQRGIHMDEGNLGPAFYGANSQGAQLVARLKAEVSQFNAIHTNAAIQLPVAHTALDAPADKIGYYTNYIMLNSITQLQLYLVNATSALVVTK